MDLDTKPDFAEALRRFEAWWDGEIVAEDLDDARAVMQHIRPEGAWFTIGGTHDRPAAEAFLRDVQRWAAGGK